MNAAEVETGEVVEPETEPEDEPEAEPETPEDEPGAAAEPAAGETEQELEAKRRKLATSALTWRNRVSAVLGEEALFLVPCELCEPDIPGFHFPAELMQPASELHARLLDVLKTPRAPDFNQAGDVSMCTACDGWGSVKTGSRKAGQETKACPSCRGFGYRPPPGVAPSGAGDEGQVLPFAPTSDGPMVTEDKDAWGSPRLLEDGQENPNYGRMPQYKDPALP